MPADSSAPIVVTGASGFVGSSCVERFAHAGARVRAVSRRRLQARSAAAEWVASPELGPDAGWTEAIRGARTVVHCAARVHVMQDRAGDPLAEFRKVNRDGTLALAHAAAAAGVRRFVFLSSIKVSGEGRSPDRPYRSDEDPAPTDAYAISKWEAESGLHALARSTGLEIVIVRPVLVYGPGVRANFRAMMRAVDMGLPLPFGSIDNRRSMIFVSNLADLIACAADHPKASGKTFLASDGEDLSTAETVRRLARAMGRPARLVPLPPRLFATAAALVGKTAVAHRLLGSLTVDPREVRETLGWSPPYTLDEGFAVTAAAYRAENPR